MNITFYQILFKFTNYLSLFISIYLSIYLSIYHPHKKAVSCFDQTLEVAPHKITVVWPFASHLTNHSSKMSKTCCALLMK